MVVKKETGVRSQEKLLPMKLGEFSTRHRTPDEKHLRSATWRLQLFDFTLQARIAGHNRAEIRNVDDPGGDIGCEKVSVSHLRITWFITSLPRGGRAATPWHGPRQRRAGVFPADSATSK